MFKHPAKWLITPELLQELTVPLQPVERQNAIVKRLRAEGPSEEIREEILSFMSDLIPLVLAGDADAIQVFESMPHAYYPMFETIIATYYDELYGVYTVGQQF